MGSRPQRKKRVAERVRVVSARDLDAARKRRLDALEADAEEELAAEAGDDEYMLSDGGGDDSDVVAVEPARSRRKTSAPTRRQSRQRASTRRQSENVRKPTGIERFNKPLQTVLDEEGPGGPAESEGGYYAIAAAPSAVPPRPLCSICGFWAPYTCTRCLVRFCSVKCGTTHEETRCLKLTL